MTAPHPKPLLEDEPIKSCPFCGTAPKDFIARDEGHLQYYTCPNPDCGIYGCGMLWDQWESRAASGIPTEELEELERHDSGELPECTQVVTDDDLRSLISRVSEGKK